LVLRTGHNDSTDATLPPVTGSEADAAHTALTRLGLCLVWMREAPSRVGELLLLPPRDPGPFIFGRGEARGDDGRLALLRQLPGELRPTGPFVCPRVSRAQLRLRPTPEGGLAVENVGSCPLLHQGSEVQSADIAVGDTLTLKNEVIFVCVRRPPIVAPTDTDLAVPPHPFGRADVFGLVGESPAIWELRQRIMAVARQPFHVLIHGESGSGKELVAQALHAQSARANRPMVSRNAATIPEGLADAELFGNIRNYPNPGMVERPGLIGEAHGSTLFLDEFAELPRNLQAHLLRVMDQGEYQRLGEASARRVDVRVVAATNRPLSDLKHDVLARFKVLIEVPGLPPRREDVPFLAAHLLRVHARSEKGVARRFFPNGDVDESPLVTPTLMEALVRHAYTAHVRELDKLLVKAALEARGRYLEVGPELKRALSSRGSRSAPPRGLEALTEEEHARLALLRKHRFSPSACGRDADYHGNRQTADLHLRQIVCRAMRIAEWDAVAAADLLAGSDPHLRERCLARIATFLTNLEARMATEPEEDLRRALAGEWRASSENVLALVAALRAGKVRTAADDT
jgi:two-component system nitrogen regulation response regulator GlnG/two-component system response regulator HydG